MTEVRYYIADFKNGKRGLSSAALETGSGKEIESPEELWTC
jgi:hypothetical protein